MVDFVRMYEKAKNKNYGFDFVDGTAKDALYNEMSNLMAYNADNWKSNLHTATVMCLAQRNAEMAYFQQLARHEQRTQMLAEDAEEGSNNTYVNLH